eukprot:2018996-Amphidinium_carterae.1
MLLSSSSLAQFSSSSPCTTLLLLVLLEVKPYSDGNRKANSFSEQKIAASVTTASSPSCI